MLSTKLLQLSFKISKADNSLFYFQNNEVTMFILVYVDDIIVSSSKPHEVTTLLKKLCDDFALKDLGDLHYFLGIEVKKVNDGIILSQDKYANDLLQRACMIMFKPVNTPLAKEGKLALHLGTPLGKNDATRYRNIVGALQYLTLIRPGIAFAINKVCQFLHTPIDEHWATVKRILWYLKGCTKLGLKIAGNSSLLMSAFSNADWVGRLNDRRSTGGYVVFLGTNLVSWSARKQPIVSHSNTESEYKVMANTTAEMMWIHTLLAEIGVPSPRQAKLWCDNLDAKYLASNVVFHGRVKHIEIDYRFVRERVAKGLLHIDYVPTCDQVAYGFTKSLAVRPFENFKYILNLTKV
jgi:hypothetical protein